MRHRETFMQSIKRVNERIGRIPIFLLVIWLLTVSWGEQSTFTGHIQDCLWNRWETWKDNANPHHVVLVADPQIVDPHTYPDRPWPLSSLTVLYTDLYLKRSYRRLLKQLQPDSTIFLGDLFDGGREWGTGSYTSPDEQYRQYGQDFWLREYQRFEDMFIEAWHEAELSRLPSDGGRRLIASVPGNHDLGFGGGINPKVKSRFDAHFGPLNRVDVLGNHTFVSLDTVSLSAMDQVDSQTGAVGTGDGSSSLSKSANIWKPVEEYLQEAKAHRERAVKREIRRLGAHSSFPELRQAASGNHHKHKHAIQDLEGSLQAGEKVARDPLKAATSQFPTIVLSHVPFYRNDGTDCGPGRERGRSIPISAGYQYQNVLTPLISKDIVDKLDASQIAMIYSGDDHDYCEIEHDRFTGRIKEITVKSMSWAMGIRKPGIQLVSLWNPVDLSSAMVSSGDSVPSPDKADRIVNMPRNTIQNHMCLLPDQLGIFMRYGELLLFTFIVLLARAILWKPSSMGYRADPKNDQPLLPMTKSHTLHNGHAKQVSSPPLRPQDHASSNNDSISSTLSAHSVTSRKGAQLGGYGSLPAEARSRSTSPSKVRYEADSDDWGMPTTLSDRVAYARVHHDPSHMSPGEWSLYHVSKWWIFRRPRTRVGVFMRSVVFVGLPVLMLYFWLLWKDI